MDEVAGDADLAARDRQARAARVPKGDQAHPERVDLPAHLERRVEEVPVLMSGVPEGNRASAAKRPRIWTRSRSRSSSGRAELKEGLVATRQANLPKSLLVRACAYALGQ